MMTTPNSFTRTSLVSIAGRTTTTVAELDQLLPHMRAVANTATGYRADLARRAVAEAELLRDQLAEADRHAETAKTLFRNATVVPGDPLREERAAGGLPPGTRPARPGGLVPELGSGAAAVLGLGH